MKAFAVLGVSVLVFCSTGCSTPNASSTNDAHHIAPKGGVKENRSASKRVKDCTKKPNYAGMLRTLCY